MTQLNKFILIAAGITFAVYLGGSVYALVTEAINIDKFVALVGVPLGLIGGWVGKVLNDSAGTAP